MKSTQKLKIPFPHFALSTTTPTSSHLTTTSKSNFFSSGSTPTKSHFLNKRISFQSDTHKDLNTQGVNSTYQLNATKSNGVSQLSRGGGFKQEDKDIWQLLENVSLFKSSDNIMQIKYHLMDEIKEIERKNNLNKKVKSEEIMGQVEFQKFISQFTKNQPLIQGSQQNSPHKLKKKLPSSSSYHNPLSQTKSRSHFLDILSQTSAVAQNQHNHSSHHHQDYLSYFTNSSRKSNLINSTQKSQATSPMGFNIINIKQINLSEKYKQDQQQQQNYPLTPQNNQSKFIQGGNNNNTLLISSSSGVSSPEFKFSQREIMSSTQIQSLNHQQMGYSQLLPMINSQNSQQTQYLFKQLKNPSALHGYALKNKENQKLKQPGTNNDTTLNNLLNHSIYVFSSNTANNPSTTNPQQKPLKNFILYKQDKTAKLLQSYQHVNQKQESILDNNEQSFNETNDKRHQVLQHKINDQNQSKLKNSGLRKVEAMDNGGRRNQFQNGFQRIIHPRLQQQKVKPYYQQKRQLKNQSTSIDADDLLQPKTIAPSQITSQPNIDSEPLTTDTLILPLNLVESHEPPSQNQDQPLTKQLPSKKMIIIQSVIRRDSFTLSPWRKSPQAQILNINEIGENHQFSGFKRKQNKQMDGNVDFETSDRCEVEDEAVPLDDQEIKEANMISLQIRDHKYE